MADRIIRLSVAAVVVLGGAGWAAARLAPTHARAVTPATPTGTATVSRTTVSQAAQVNGTLTFGGAHAVLAGGQGLVTRLPALGAVITRGHAVYESEGRRIPLLYGTRPAWRAFTLGMTDGVDVLQLERNLRALGYGAGLTVDRHFSLATYYAVKRWRDATTGDLPLGRVVFLPGPLRVSGLDAKVGQPLQPGLAVLHGTDPAPVVDAQLDPTAAPQVRVRDKVTVTMPDGRRRKGRVVSISPVAQNQQSQDGGQGQSYVPMTIKLSGRLGRVLDQTYVQVAVTSEEHKDVLAVPIVALVARPGGHYAVTVVEGSARRNVPVETGLFDETQGVVEVTGVTEGAVVEVPVT